MLQVRCMMAVLLLIGQKLEVPEIIDQLLDVQNNPRKPQYRWTDCCWRNFTVLFLLTGFLNGYNSQLNYNCICRNLSQTFPFLSPAWQWTIHWCCMTATLKVWAGNRTMKRWIMSYLHYNNTGPRVQWRATSSMGWSRVWRPQVRH